MTDVYEVNTKNDDSKYVMKDNSAVKEEDEVTVKREVVECVVCLSRVSEHADINLSKTQSGTSLYVFLCKFTHEDLAKPNLSKFICKTCLDLVNLLESAEIEYLKVKDVFETIISKNPLFDGQITTATVSLSLVKNETLDSQVDANFNDDSEDEPLALTKKKRHSKLDKRKKKVTPASKRKLRGKQSSKDNWACSECNDSGEHGGQEALTAHVLLSHSTPPTTDLEKVKKEETPDGLLIEVTNEVLKLEDEAFADDDDDSSSYLPDEVTNGRSGKRSGFHMVSKEKGKKKVVMKKKRDPKVLHRCDQCHAKYTSLVRLEHHKLKHDNLKPPFICEICGAHYKHKRACDIHVAMHKGISDWKCEECNKLFPSKGALQRHNNIHTGKCNYQCDLCGKSFIHTSSFKMHKLSHSGVKPHACDVCGLALMTRSHLKRHKRVHSGEKRHECGACGKRFSERYNLLAHARAHDAPAAPVPPAAPVAPLPPRRRLFRCAFCADRFERRYMLERHCAAEHGRALERPPPTPRNTMSKLLKAQAQRRADTESKDSRSPEAKSPPLSQKLLSQSSSSAEVGAVGAGVSVINASAWAGAYAAEFGLRDFHAH